MAAIIDIDSKWWKVSLPREIFGMEEEKIISKIPLSKYGWRDVLIWWGTTTGEFSVCSAYRMEKERSKKHREKDLLAHGGVAFGSRFGV